MGKQIELGGESQELAETFPVVQCKMQKDFYGIVGVVKGLYSHDTND